MADVPMYKVARPRAKTILRYRVLSEALVFDRVYAEYIAARLREPIEACQKVLDELVKEGVLERIASKRHIGHSW